MIDPHLREIKQACVERYLRPELGVLASWSMGFLTRRPVPNALLAPFNVHAIGIARKLKNGQKTDQLSIRVTVFRKMEPGEVASSGGTLVDREIAGIPTDVVEDGPLVIEPQGDSAGDPQALENRRPLQPGCSISHGNVLFGTLGAFCRSKKQGERQNVYMLSCRHVLAGFSTHQIRLEIYQPGNAAHPQPAERVAGGFDRFVDTADPNVTPPAYSADAAIAQLDPQIRFTTEYLGIGASAGIIDILAPDADEQELLRDRHFVKFGRTTGRTVGTLEVIRENRIALLGGRTRVFNDQFVVKRLPDAAVPMSDPGDSGAMVFHEESRRAAGLVIGAPIGPNNDEETIVSPLAPILKELEIELL
jgi:hypothetical protein